MTRDISRSDKSDVEATVLMTVYRDDEPDQLLLALESIVQHQTRLPDSVTLVVDGPVPDGISDAIEKVRATCPKPLDVIALPENVGLSNALNAGLSSIDRRARYIIRQDADDIARPSRVARQIEFMDAHPDCAVASGHFVTFDGTPENPIGQRRLPLGAKIRQFALSRTPINHSCAILRASALQDRAYPDTRLPFEDWWLSLRLLKQGWDIGVIDEILLDVRAGPGMLARRRGAKYARQERQFFREIVREGLMTRQRALRNIAIRSTVRALPTGAVRYLYKKIMHA